MTDNLKMLCIVKELKKKNNKLSSNLITTMNIFSKCINLTHSQSYSLKRDNYKIINC